MPNEQNTEVIVIDSDVHAGFLGKSWTDIFWLIAAGGLAAIGWRMVEKLAAPKPPKPQPTPQEGE